MRREPITGRKHEEVFDILKGCDVILDGYYIEEQREQTRKILWSTIQKIIILSNMWPNCEKLFFDNVLKEVEINVGDYIIASGDEILWLKLL